MLFLLISNIIPAIISLRATIGALSLFHGTLASIEPLDYWCALLAANIISLNKLSVYGISSSIVINDIYSLKNEKHIID